MNAWPADRRVRHAAVVLLLVAILAVSGWLRFTGLKWDEGQQLHPDERFLMMVTAALGTPESVQQYFDSAASPLNPRNRGYTSFVYGTLPTTLLHFIGAASGRTGYDALPLVGRAMSATADLLTVVLAFLLGAMVTRRLAGGLLAGALYGLAVLPIQQSHFFVVDPLANLFTTASLTMLVWNHRTPGWWKWPAAGALWGAALACKLSVYTFLAIPLLLALWQAWEPGRGLRLAGEPRRAALERALVRWICFGAAAFAVLRVAMPDAFRGPGLAGIIPEDRWLANINEARRLVSGEVDFPPGHQWTNRARYWFPWVNMVLWGTGPLLGAAAWLGLAWASIRTLRGRGGLLLLPVAWAALLFAHQGGQWVMSMRYLLPIYPAFAVLAAWALLELARARSRRLALAAGGMVLIGTLLWAVAFTAIYRSPHPRVAASRWMLQEIPRGTAIGNEIWDDALPLRVDGHDPFGGEYRGVDMHWYAEDEPAKLDQAVQWLARADTLVLSSNRLYDSIPRLWMRFPMTTRYYEALFAGELGFERAAEFRSYPRLGPIEFPDQSSEEAFTVYDHPRVLIYRKTPAFSEEKVRRILGEALPEEVLRLTPLQEARAPGGLRFSESQWQRRPAVAQALPDGDGPGAVVVAILFFLLLGPLTAPILFVAAPMLPDRGWALSRCVGLVLVGWLPWLMASIQVAPLTRGSIAVACAVLAAVSAALAWRERAAWSAFLRARWRVVVAAEVVSCVAFAAMLVSRWLNPDLWNSGLSGEKPMEMAYLNAVLRCGEFPPHSPWLAGATMNYYYFGFVMAAAPMRLCNVAPEVGFNIAIAGFYAIFGGALFGAGGALVGSLARCRRVIGGGVLAVFFSAVAGDLAQIKLLWRHFHGEGVRPESWFWDATRVISHPPTEAGPITEFPFFTFLFADLHPHLMALPMLVALLAVAFALSKAERVYPALAAIGALLLGTLWVTNPWDLPLGALMLLLALGIAAWGKSRVELGRRVAIWIGMVLAARLLFLPFHEHFGKAYGAFELWRGSRTVVGEYLQVHGGLLAIALPALLGGFAGSRLRRGAWVILAVAAVLGAALAVGGYTLPGLLFVVVAGCAVALLRRGVDDWTWPLLMTVGAVALGIFVEVLVLRGDISRMNTVFKFTLQAWVLLALAGSAFVLLVDQRAKGGARIAWRVFIALLGGMMVVYPLTAVPARVADRMAPTAPHTLDGLAFLAEARIEQNGVAVPLADDLAGVRWLRANATGLPVIAEATTHPQLYGWGARFSNHTGLPTIVGWDWHQRQQYAALPVDVVMPRVEDVKSVYTTEDSAAAWRLLRKHRAEFVVVGGLERALFPKAGIDKFPAGDGVWWSKVFEQGALVIYRVSPDPPRDK